MDYPEKDQTEKDQSQERRLKVKSARRAGGWALLVAGVLAVVVASVAVAWNVGVLTGSVPFPNVTFFGLPVLICAVVFWIRGKRPEELNALVGFNRGDVRTYVIAVFVAALWVGFTVVLRNLLVPGFTPEPAPQGLPEMGLLALIAVVFITQAFTVTLGEEVLFRGLIDGWAMRRYGYYAGNVLGTTVFAVAHLPLLFTAGFHIWPLFSVIVVAAWVLGWMRHRSGSIWPGWLAHTLTNTLSYLAFLVLVL